MEPDERKTELPKHYDDTRPKLKFSEKKREYLPELFDIILNLNEISRDVAIIEISNNPNLFTKAKMALRAHEHAVEKFRRRIEEDRNEIKKQKKLK